MKFMMFFKKYPYFFYFFRKMEGIFEKTSLICNKIEIIELYWTGEEVHDVYSGCNQNCVSKVFRVFE